MEPLLVYPDPPSQWVSVALERAGYPWRAVSDPALAERDEPEDGYAGAVISALKDPVAAFSACRILRKGDSPLQPLLLIVSQACLAELELREDLFDDFVLENATAEEVEARLTHLFWRTGRGKNLDLIVYGPGDLPGGDPGAPPGPDVHGVRAPPFPSSSSWPGVQSRDALVAGLGL
jgi:DNA-binding response OmpR family regulator